MYVLQFQKNLKTTTMNDHFSRNGICDIFRTVLHEIQVKADE